MGGNSITPDLHRDIGEKKEKEFLDEKIELPLSLERNKTGLGIIVCGMKKLLSLPPNLVNRFHEIEQVSPEEWFCASDPGGVRLGSGGGTAWLLEAAHAGEDPDLPFGEWLGKEKRILLHAGGQSRRLPAYAPSGKILTPIPVFRWARGQRLSQDLLSLQVPLYERIMRKAPASLRTLVASGDVYIRATRPVREIPEADVVCYGLWVDPSLATRHGVFALDRRSPDELDFMLQKPSLERLGELAGSHLVLMDIGIWLLSDRAVNLLVERSRSADGQSMRPYDLYAEFGLSLGKNPRIQDPELNRLSVAILPLEGGEFYHYGTSRELISSTLAVQNLVSDQRMIMQRKVKPHPAMFVQNALLDKPLTSANSEVWIENSYIPSGWELGCRHIITGVPVNDWRLSLPEGACVDAVPVGESEWVARPYGFEDLFKGRLSDEATRFMGRPFLEWARERGIFLVDEEADIQDAPLFPVCADVDALGEVFSWMIADPGREEGRRIWLSSRRLSANQLMEQANLPRLVRQRGVFREKTWSRLAANHERSVFYQLDLSDAAREFARGGIALPDPLSEGRPLMERIHDRMFRSRVMKLSGVDYEEEEQAAFALLREELRGMVALDKQSPRLNVYRDQIVWGRSPVRIDLAGGWTDTPPYCLYAGGDVVNAAVLLNGQPPLQVYIKSASTYKIILRSIDLGAMEVISDWEELRMYNKVGSPFSIPKAALALAGFLPEFSADRFGSLEEQLRAFGGGIEITLLAAVPAGSGLGTSSILAATVLGALSDFCGLAWDKGEIGNRTLILEQLLTTGGGWQDQYGGILHGLKLLHTEEGLDQRPQTRWLPEYLFTDPECRSCHLLYYTGITRTAKGILAEIVRGMFLNNGRCLDLLAEMKAHALDLYEVISRGDFDAYGRLIAKSWQLNKALDAGTNPAAVEAIISEIHPLALGYKLPGAGGGGYLYIVAKDPEAARRIRQRLASSPSNPNARFVDMELSGEGLQISRS